MNRLRIHGYEGPLLHYSVYDESGTEMKEARVEIADLQAEGLERQVPMISLLAEREGCNFYQPESPLAFVESREAATGEPVRLHYHDEFNHAHELEEHGHPHNHAEEFAAFQKRVEELWAELQQTLGQLREHQHPFVPHQHPLTVHGHDPIEHQHPELALGSHGHEMQNHAHPLPTQVAPHEHQPVEHDHPPHEHLLEEHQHPFMTHEHPAHGHELERHEHPPALPAAHEHPLSEHEHPPHEHPEIWGVGEQKATASIRGHLHRFDTMTADGRGFVCGICGIPKNEVTASG